PIWLPAISRRPLSLPSGLTGEDRLVVVPRDGQLHHDVLRVVHAEADVERRLATIEDDGAGCPLEPVCGVEDLVALTVSRLDCGMEHRRVEVLARLVDDRDGEADSVVVSLASHRPLVRLEGLR